MRVGYTFVDDIVTRSRAYNTYLCARPKRIFHGGLGAAAALFVEKRVVVPQLGFGVKFAATAICSAN